MKRANGHFLKNHDCPKTPGKGTAFCFLGESARLAIFLRDDEGAGRVNVVKHGEKGLAVL
jgi:hypothetical protein